MRVDASSGRIDQTIPKGTWKGQNLMDYFGFPSSNYPNGQSQRITQDVEMTQETVSSG
ncbi:hypothetical protein XAP412_410078 [Xanthomonas phaseoli pv. phaseoli]|uniref:Uncharacterized protein n=1 Tax=Xanthomonas campestris pv. phaseoli TaxID=317013 RepID=A0AB38E0R4_XANCH|nr:hypothetical protein [Xanthomonas sp. ISO98C4]SON85253.1 hypothetical protein XAP412_410078 [Xanthomonas phaseoli pv. phaseoli]SON89757.1 hypothetical protein XAP7430_430077 [Xanthomonas phaseoli pv. phaseoli]SOO27978.1 hypothetical protein XAP6164_2040007 [Xanthomonas phaseoli pv. phaseoli]